MLALAALVNIFGLGAFAAWGLGGGDGERNVRARVLALLVWRDCCCSAIAIGIA